MNLTIRQATDKDATLIADISRQTFYDTFAAQNTAENMKKFLDEQFTRGRLMMEVGRAGSTFLLAFSGTEVAGYAKLRETHTPAALAGKAALEIARLYACQPFIGKGVGHQLMEACLNLGREKGKELAWLCVWEHNQRAIDFYTRWGFEKFGDIDFLLGNDLQNDWMMQRPL